MDQTRNKDLFVIPCVLLHPSKPLDKKNYGMLSEIHLVQSQVNGIDLSTDFLKFIPLTEHPMTLHLVMFHWI